MEESQGKLFGNCPLKNLVSKKEPVLLNEKYKD